MKKLFAAILIVSFAFTANAQDCYDQLRALYKHMETQMHENTGNVFQLKYQMTNLLSVEQGGNEVSTRVEILSQGEKSYFMSDQASVFQDANRTYTVVPTEKEIIISPNHGESIRQARLNQITNMQLQIFSVAEPKSCREVMRNGVAAKELVVEIPMAKQAELNIREIVFVADFENQNLFETTIKYVIGSQIASTKMVYEAVNYNLKTNRLAQPVANEIFVSGEQLSSKYQDYKVIDYSNQ